MTNGPYSAHYPFIFELSDGENSPALQQGEEEMAAAGRRGLSDAARERKNRRRRELRQQRKLEREEERRRSQQEAEEAAAAATSDGEPPLPPSQAATLLPILASAAASSFRFLDEHGHLLLPSHSLSLESVISGLHSLLLRPPFPRAPPAPADGQGCSGGNYWFLRFLASAASDGADPRWVEAFRMSRSSFYLLLQTLAPSLSCHSSVAAMGAAPPPPPDHKLGAALFRLAHAAPFRAVARRFGIGGGGAAACRAFYEVCRSVTDRLGHLFELPSDVKRVVEGFRWEASLPNCGGVLGFARFSVGDDDGGAVLAQVVVDSEGRFLDVSAGWPGSMSPAQILPRTKLFSSPAAKGLPAAADGHEVDGVPGPSPPRYLLGGSSCPLLPWLLTPFPESDTGEEDHPSRRVFNEVHAQGMKLAAKAVEAIRWRWRLLPAGWSSECAEALPFVIVVSCLLHNFLFKCSEVVPEEALDLAVEERFPGFEGKGNEEGERVREALAAHLYSVSQKDGLTVAAL
ncbi:hypothetical protein Taro_015588 [Colocasia esculenta]|uniref:DDE Tnp4 domain-containing protein n=1 Tax=Colocasia esculenta TaxID=4460 RepID=A0A843ULL7_COLES|nr:hypothetical protein [Colocasia esculenta]